MSTCPTCRNLATALRDLSPGPHTKPMNAEEYIPLIKAYHEYLESEIQNAYDEGWQDGWHEAEQEKE